MDGSGVDTSLLVTDPNRGFLIAEEVKFVFNLGIGIFATVAVGSFVYFIWAVRRSIRGLQSFVILFIIATSIPITVLSIFSSQNVILNATGIIRIENLRVVERGANSVEIIFETTDPKMAYLEYKDYSERDIRFILPMGEFEKKRLHRFLINNISAAGGEASILIGGKKFGYYGEPIRIK